ncbi:divalent cation tolerance protein CutA [Helicobacter saguini]|uniref:Divalent-cation tolerance protein CutA n=1 Tax=Helicobacter saguini TaxID=1548018 RepID=A0A347VSX4_9HELI|nr:divalent-cation tolerance protein CutA [Helicobacter saguini]MWV62329.1 divalent cation tolerance protein CutA [Helicobacter saguini]MWV67000.1 divalent cation tolerance protein CutA [Helicobacter saguini]MWV69348.1 divalent cation tolerance protein CutA [Helicobacter saguini]MWV71097.1 divalent cation tolerance protein CutA [Helicobacter saguini]TLD95007.1 divalent-cation tolerance protein CutA [Helicobacter saguini]
MLILYTTFDDRQEAYDIAQNLIEKRLAACVQVSKIKTFYRWENKLEKQKEYMLTCKLDSKRLKKITKYIRKNHSYDLPELVVIKPKYVDKKYKRWLKN